MRAFVLAGGKGERLHPITYWHPKALIHVGGKPCVRWIVEKLLEQGFEVVLCIQQETEPSFRYEFRDLPVKFSTSEEPMGTAGELFVARKLIDNTFLTVYADDLTFLNYREGVEFHRRCGADATLILTDNIPLDFGLVRLLDGNVIEFREKPKINMPSWTGVAVMEPVMLKYFGPSLDLARDVFQRAIAEGIKILSFMTHEEWLDIGIISHLKRADSKLRERG